MSSQWGSLIHTLNNVMPMFLERSGLPKLIKTQVTASQRWTWISFIGMGHWWIDLVWGLNEKDVFKYRGKCLKTTYEKQNLNNKEYDQSHLSTMMFWFVFKVSRFVEDIRQNKTHNQVDTLRNSVRVFFSSVQSREIDLTRATSHEQGHRSWEKISQEAKTFASFCLYSF